MHTKKEQGFFSKPDFFSHPPPCLQDPEKSHQMRPYSMTKRVGTSQSKQDM